MRRMAIGLALIGMALQAWGSKSVTVDELKQAVAAEHGKPDADLAQDLSQLELSQRLSQTVLAGLKAAAPGEKTAQELDVLADQSVFLPLPPAEIPSTPSPDAKTQRAIVASMINYITTTIHQMPNFVASRVTSSFEDRPQGTLSSLPLHQVGQSTVSVVYQGGQEVDTVKGKKRKSSADGLVSWGEFGPILSTVLLDAAHSQFVWGHWEQEAGSTLAVFRYQVPQKKSHYEVRFCCVIQGRVADADSFGGEWYRQTAGYHGEMAVDPATGAIRRLTVVSDLSPDSPMLTASIAVSYGSVEIGGKNYICPVRSVAIATRRLNETQHGVLLPQEMSHGPILTRLNEVAFDHYRMFRGESRILTDEEAKEEGAPLPPATSSDAAQPAAAEAATPPAAAPVEQNPEERAMVAAPPPPPAPPSPAPATPTPPPAAIAADTKTAAQPEVPLFKTTSREVLVDVVVTKNDGDPVLGLDKQDFAVKENGKEQTINFFEPHTNEHLKPSAPPEMPQLPAGSVTNVPPAPPSDAINVLLIDVLNTETPDTSNVRKQVMAFLGKMQPGTRMAIFVLGSQLRCLQGFTSDSSALLAAFQDKQDGLNGQKSQFLKTRGDQAGDDESIAMLKVMDQGMPSAGIEGLQAALGNATDRSMGMRISMTFEALTYLGHYLSGIPGRKNLIWFSGSFPIALFPSAEQMENLQKNPNLPGYVNHLKRTADLFTVSQIAVYPISAEGMMAEHVAEADAAGPGAPPLGTGHAGSQADTTMGPYNAAASARADTVSAMEQLAASTGGKAYYNTNDLNAALRRALADGSEYYTVGYTPTVSKLDGSYRHIDLKLAHGRYKLAYRRGYNADDVASSAAKPSENPLTPLLQLGLPGATGILYGVHAAPAAIQPAPGGERAGQNPRLLDPVTRYSVEFVIRAQDLDLQPDTQGGRSGKLLLGLKAYDLNGAALNWAGDEETIQVEPNQYASVREKGIPVHLDIDVPASGKVDLVTAVYDMDSGTAGTLEIPLRSSHPAGTAAR